MFLRLLILTLAASCFGNEKATQKIFQLENEYVKVWRTVILPDQPLKLHRHDYERVVVGLKGGKLIIRQETGESRELDIETGKAYWLTDDPPDLLHADVNESDEPIEVMVIEVKSTKNLGLYESDCN